MKRSDIKAFAEHLQEAGLPGAHGLIRDALIPLGVEKGLTLYQAAWEYADRSEHPESTHFMLYQALETIEGTNRAKIKKLGIHEPLS